MAAERRYRIKHKHSIRGLDVLQAVFAFLMALGLREVFIGAYDFFTVIVFGATDLFTAKKILFLIMFLNVILLAMRFFWTPRNLRRLVYEAAQDAKTTHQLPALGDGEVSLHVFIILLHGMIFYLIGAEFEFVAFQMTSSAPLETSIFSGYILMHLLLLIMNFLWLGLIDRRMNQLHAAHAGDAPARETLGAQLWFRNNLVCSVLAIGPFVVADRCGGDSFDCLVSTGDAFLPVPLIPSSPVVTATLFEWISDRIPRFLSVLGTTDQPAATGGTAMLFWVLGVLLFNSVWDLLKTGKYYLVLEEIEWESEPGPYLPPRPDELGGGAPAKGDPASGEAVEDQGGMA